MAHRSLPLIQSSAVLMTLNSLGTVVRMALALTSSRWARNSSVLGYLPMLHAPARNGPAPVTALRVPEELARRICHIVLPCFGLLRLPVMVALFVCSTSPSWREWCAPQRAPLAAAWVARPHPHRSVHLCGHSGARVARGRQPWSRAGIGPSRAGLARAGLLWFHTVPLPHAIRRPGICGRPDRGQLFEFPLGPRRESRLFLTDTCALRSVVTFSQVHIEPRANVCRGHPGGDVHIHHPAGGRCVVLPATRGCLATRHGHLLNAGRHHRPPHAGADAPPRCAAAVHRCSCAARAARSGSTR